MTFVSLWTAMVNHAGISIMVATVIVLLLALLSLAFDNRSQVQELRTDIQKIKQSLFGNEYEQEVNGDGLYQKVKRVEDKLSEEE